MPDLTAAAPMLLEARRGEFSVFNPKNGFIAYYVVQLGLSALVTLANGSNPEIGLDLATNRGVYEDALLLSIGGLGMLVSLVIALAVTVAWLLGLTDVAGYTPLMLTIVFSVSALFFSQGLLGGYIWRTFENTKRRPLFVPMLHEIFGSEGRA